ncbi:UDP pyrophosphate synthase [Aerococcus urinaehominis]|uniref:Isoprenyl transferase n=1 Tax=Aerococcus urinaehominis TaxID=128944 RepID=A0A109RGG2_9LACT|nr:isoprenyl transferase [Aerococcus urinaehominis]AMB98829.1 UDP pyrophosphate synthase [Aerococcus urinaehominis]SDM48581.1 undecaprenyl diphosphate synthase [Aerococcus urinaehominis]
MIQENLVFNPELPVPQHVAVIMDGNGRWAQAQGLKRTAGHREGLNALRRVAIAAAQMGIKVITAYAFSTENWRRPQEEISYLMSLPKLLNDDVLPELMANDVKITITGSLEGVNRTTQAYINEAIAKTKDNKGLILNIAFNYGSRAEIVKASQSIAQQVAEGQLAVGDIDEELFSRSLQTAFLNDLQDPDFLIRSSGEVRLSNYLLWQLAYSEMYFVDTMWPDFDQSVFESCIAVYQHRHRRFGDVS